MEHKIIYESKHRNVIEESDEITVNSKAEAIEFIKNHLLEIINEVENWDYINFLISSKDRLGWKKSNIKNIEQLSKYTNMDKFILEIEYEDSYDYENSKLLEHNIRTYYYEYYENQ